MNRIEKICSYIDDCKTFIDVGCDHGYCTQYALKNGKCQNAIVTDVSPKCLAKAENLLAEYINDGRCKSVCCDGLTGVEAGDELVLIAGMGGMEIIKILSEGFIPNRFILQPMKNAEKLRLFLIENGCKICVDDIFYDGKYYFIIKGERFGGTVGYDSNRLKFGRDSLQNPIFSDYAKEEVAKLESYGQQSALAEQINFLKKAAALK